MHFSTADLCDHHEHRVQIAAPLFFDYGGVKRFFGPISTVKVHEDNTLVRAVLEEPGQGRVLVVDGGGSLRCALVGDVLADLAWKNGWVGLIIYGCIRDSVAIAKIGIGVKALNTNPRKSVKKDAGDRDIPVSFAEVNFIPGHYLYADEDGILVSREALIA